VTELWCRGTDYRPVWGRIQRQNTGRQDEYRCQSKSGSKYNILSVPFLLIFDNGILKEGMPGGMQKHDLMMKMAPYI